MNEIAPGIFHWTARHPEWRSSVEEVQSYALVIDGALVLVDPQLPPHADPHRSPLLMELDARAADARRVHVIAVSPYHTRDSEDLCHRWREGRPTALWGHPRVRARLRREDTELCEIPRTGGAEGADFAGGLARAFTISRPKRQETPVYLPRARALAFADAVVGDGVGLRVWNETEIGHDSLRSRLHPTLRPLLEFDVGHVLVTHGPPVVERGREALAAALDAEPVDALPWPPRGHDHHRVQGS
jgi:hypothetical protein